MTDLWTGGIGGSSRSDSRILTGGIRGRWDRTLGNARMDAALDFITSGNFDRVNAYGVGVFDTGGGANNLNPSRCRTSSDCGVGYMCGDGACRRSSSTGTSTGGGTSNGRTDINCPTDLIDDIDPTTSPPGGGSCGGGGGGRGGGTVAGPCTKPSCGGTTSSGSGGGGGGADCCGQRCCRTIGAGAVSTVQCFCGPCPPPGRCQKWCDSFYKSNGRQAEGCSDALTCSECEACVTGTGLWTAKCIPTSGTPCWCEFGARCVECETCQEDGTCEYNCANCETCYIQYNVPCSCGYFNIECCVSTCDEYSISHKSCSEGGCAKACGDPPGGDPCAAKCDTTTVCGSPGSGLPDCPPGYKGTGSITTHHGGGDVSCRLCEKCKLPPECEPCDCNCHDECPDCQICNAEGKCVPDPACDKCNEGQTLCADLETCCGPGSRCVSIYTNVFLTSPSGGISTYGSVGPIQYSFEGANGQPKECNSCNPTRPRMVISNSSLFSDKTCDGGSTFKVCYQDSVCFGAEAFTPVLISSEISSVRCCSNN